MRICIKRVYEAASPDDGERILVALVAQRFVKRKGCH